MSTRPFEFARSGALLCAVLGLVASGARGQFAPSLPYNTYSQPYQAFSYPTIVNPSLPNQARTYYGAPVASSVAPSTVAPGRAAGVEGAGEPYAATSPRVVELTLRRNQLQAEWRGEADPERRSELARELSEVIGELRGSLAARRRTSADDVGASATSAPVPSDVPGARSSRRLSGSQRGPAGASAPGARAVPLEIDLGDDLPAAMGTGRGRAGEAGGGNASAPAAGSGGSASAPRGNDVGTSPYGPGGSRSQGGSIGRSRFGTGSQLPRSRP